MTPSEKAYSLVEKYIKEIFAGEFMPTEYSKMCAKACAIIAVNEIIELFKEHDGPKGTSYLNEGKFFWMQVKIEIEKL